MNECTWPGSLGCLSAPISVEVGSTASTIYSSCKKRAWTYAYDLPQHIPFFQQPPLPNDLHLVPPTRHPAIFAPAQRIFELRNGQLPIDGVAAWPRGALFDVRG